MPKFLMNEDNVMREKLEALLKEGAEKIAASQSENELQEVKVQLLGKKGAVTELLKEIPKLDVSLRPEMGRDHRRGPRRDGGRPRRSRR